MDVREKEQRATDGRKIVSTEEAEEHMCAGWEDAWGLQSVEKRDWSSCHTWPFMWEGGKEEMKEEGIAV